MEVLVSNSSGDDEPIEPTATLDLGESEGQPRGSVPAPADGHVQLSSRYELRVRLGQGGMGEVWRVWDRQLGRPVALKRIQGSQAARAVARERFRREATATARLQHPGIVPVYDFGALDDGQLYYTMKEVNGRTLATLLSLLHGASEGGGWARPVGGWTFRRLVEVERQVGEAVAYAHEMGVLHRDLKPANIMVGAFGEVLVMDWGRVKLLDEEGGQPVVAGRSPRLTRAGGGTMGFMAPEQARGDLAAVGPAADAYALGAILLQLLTGDPPSSLAGLPVEPPAERIPSALWALARATLQPEPAARPTAAELSAEIQGWLDGARRRDRALVAVQEALHAGERAAALRREAHRQRAAAEEQLAGVDPLAPEEEKVPAWQELDLARANDHRAALAELEVEQRLAGALQIDPATPQAHEQLVIRALRAHRLAEEQRDDSAALRAESQLRTHSEALPAAHPRREEAQAYLVGDGALTLVTDPPGAEVRLFRFVRHRRRLVARPVRVLGATPLHAVTLPMGSYLCELHHPDCAPVRYPVWIRRQHHWEGIEPGGHEPRPVWLPPRGLLGPDDCYVPAGWFPSGGDPEALNPRPERWVWIDPWVVRRHQVTTEEYLAFLDDLVRQGREDEALRHAPREQPASGRELGAMIMGYESGRFVRRPDADGDLWDLRMPVLMIDAAGADACAAWLAERSGSPWQLLPELVWEKAARGVDGRWFPWGDEAEPTFSCYRDSHAGRPVPATVDDFPVDCSVYGIRGMAGNVCTWCDDDYRSEGPAIVDDRPAPTRSGDRPYRAVRGSSWTSSARRLRGASRMGSGPTMRSGLGLRVGWRVVRGG